MRTGKITLLFLLSFCACYVITGPSCNRSGSTARDVRDSILVVPAMKLVVLWIDSGYYSRARPYLDSFYSASKISSKNALGMKYERLAELYFYNERNYPLSVEYLDSLQMIVEEDTENRLNLNTRLTYYFLRGNHAINDKKYDDAFKFFYKGKKLIDSSPNTCNIQRYYNTLGYMLFRQEKFVEAAQYMKKSYEEASLCGPDAQTRLASVKREALSNTGICYENAGMLDSAVIYYERALTFLEENQDKFKGKELAALKFKGIVLGNMGGTLFKQKKYDEAIRLLKQSIEINSRPEGERGDAILTKIKLADLYFEVGDEPRVHELLEQLNVEVVEHPYIISDLRLALFKHKYYKRSKDYGKALYYLTLHDTLKDSVKASSDYNIESHADHVKEFENLEQKYELELTKQQSELKNWYIFLAAVVTFMMLIIAGLMLRRRSANKKHIIELTELNRTVSETNGKLMQSLQLLQKSQDENARMIKIVAHDLRSPIAGIVSLVRMMKGDDEELTKQELSQYIELVEKAGGNALSFIEDMLNFNRTNRDLVKSDVKLDKLLESCINIIRPQADKKNLQIRFSAEPLVIKANEEKIWRVFNNILSNAIKFSPPSTEIEVMATASGNEKVLIVIKDEGTGIPDHVKDKMFTMFSLPGVQGTEGEPSYGLGMAISKQIIDAHNGKIWFKTEVGKGTTFFVKLPVQ